jgi:hypothetical protein
MLNDSTPMPNDMPNNAPNKKGCPSAAFLIFTDAICF